MIQEIVEELSLMALLETKNLSYRYGTGTPFEVAALDDVNIQIEKGELLAIIGHTGSGKSTLVQHLNGLLKPQQGQVIIDGQDIWQDKHTVRAARFKVGLCFQYPEYQLFESTVYKDIAFGPVNMGLSEAEVDECVRASAEYVGLAPEQLSKSPFELSGGEKRRVAIAGVMAMRPEILVLDEPTAGLDPRGRERLMRLICNYRETTSNTVVIVSHNMDEVAEFATRVLVMNNSRVAMSGSVGEVFSRYSEISSMGLTVPQITSIFASLRSLGIELPDDVFTVERGEKELLSLLRREGRL
ncbi:MAG: energy-coupling factor transporter ATPase [Clostridiales bacterium]|nr:energy-coupling factor transporter ATPase [Clostridiales bacterium]